MNKSNNQPDSKKRTVKELTAEELSQVTGGALQRDLNEQAEIGDIRNKLEYSSSNLQIK